MYIITSTYTYSYSTHVYSHSDVMSCFHPIYHLPENGKPRLSYEPFCILVSHTSFEGIGHIFWHVSTGVPSVAVNSTLPGEYLLLPLCTLTLKDPPSRGPHSHDSLSVPTCSIPHQDDGVLLTQSTCLKTRGLSSLQSGHWSLWVPLPLSIRVEMLS